MLRVIDRALTVMLGLAAGPVVARAVQDPDEIRRWVLVVMLTAILVSAWLDNRHRHRQG